MKIVPVVISIALLIGAPPLAYAQTAGFQHGVHDAQTSDIGQWYILQPGQGFAFHTKQIVEDYIRGFCAISPNTSSDAEQASLDCAQGPTSASWMSEK